MSAATVPEPATWAHFPAFRLANAHLEALVVPALGRVMRFSRAGGLNHLWTDNIPRQGEAYVSVFGWANWGGDKTWLAPQSRWPEMAGPGRMGDPAWGEPIHGEHNATLLPDGGLRVTGPVSRFSGLRVSRDYRLDGDEFVLVQRVENVASPGPRRISLWSVTNVPRPEVFYALPSAGSPYPDGVLRQARYGDEILIGRAGPFITFRPANRRPIKFGLDADHAALAAVHAGELFIQRAERPPGAYPDASRARPDLPGLCVEYFDAGADSPLPYAELELLGPLVTLAPGETTTHAVRWSLHPLPVPDAAPDLDDLARRLRQPVPRPR